MCSRVSTVQKKNPKSLAYIVLLMIGAAISVFSGLSGFRSELGSALAMAPRSHRDYSWGHWSKKVKSSQYSEFCYVYKWQVSDLLKGWYKSVAHNQIKNNQQSISKMRS